MTQAEYLGSPALAHDSYVTTQSLEDFAAKVIEIAHAGIADRTPEVELCQPNLLLAVHLENSGYRRLLREKLCSRCERDPASDRCTIILASSGQFGLGHPPGWGEEFYVPRDVEKALAHSRFRVNHLRDYRYWQIFDSEARLGVQWMAADDAYPPWEEPAPLRAFLHWFYSTHGMRLAHAGTLGRGGSGVLLAGKGGSGKSGTVAAGLLHGLQTVGDDYVIIECNGKGVTAYPIFRTLKQDSAGLERLGLGSITGSRSPNWQDKYEFLCSDIQAAEMPESLAIRAIIVPEAVGGQASAIEPISPAQAMLALAPSGVTQMPGERDAGVALFAKLVRSLPCYGMQLGTNPKEISSRIEALIARDAA